MIRAAIEKASYLGVWDLFHEGHLDDDHPVLPMLATLKSFKELDTITLPEEAITEIEELFDEIYGKTTIGK